MGKLYHKYDEFFFVRGIKKNKVVRSSSVSDIAAGLKTTIDSS